MSHALPNLKLSSSIVAVSQIFIDFTHLLKIAKKYNVVAMDTIRIVLAKHKFYFYFCED